MNATEEKSGKTVGVRLPKPIMDALVAESDRDGIRVTSLVRRAVLRAFAAGLATDSSMIATTGGKPTTVNGNSRPSQRADAPKQPQAEESGGGPN